MSTNCEANVIFPIFGRVGAIQKLTGTFHLTKTELELKQN